ncbi:hypothetical protein ACLB9Y_04905 [Chryseobacterium scophthalmum]|uniref:hypothetical protein n=1 Tax=Chryseobacterium scophthalmum TaxID=59733 RepID=UPI00398AD92B
MKKTIYFNYIEYVIGQAVDAIFDKDLDNAYKVRFNEIKESVLKKDIDFFFQRLRESFKIALNNLEKISLFEFFFMEDFAPSDKNEDLKEIFFLMWEVFFPGESWQDGNYKEISFEINKGDFYNQKNNRDCLKRQSLLFLKLVEAALEKQQISFTICTFTKL